jgi:NTE family protein
VTDSSNGKIAVVFSGGVGLGAYQAGAYVRLQDELQPQWLAGSSAGAVNAAIIAGSAPEQRAEALTKFWMAGELVSANAASDHRARSVSWTNLLNWMSALQSRLIGSPGFFDPSLVSLSASPPALYDLSPMRERLARLVDFGRVNAGEFRVIVATTDIETGDLVVFDTGRGDRIAMDHLLASCGLLPEFAPVEIGGQLLGDGGLCANAPVDAVLGSGTEDVSLCFVIDVFARDGSRPTDLQTSLARRQELFFGNQTYRQLTGHLRARRLGEDGKSVAQGAPEDTQRRPFAILYLSYRPAPEEAGPEKGFDFSARSLRQRWRAGALDMGEALNVHRALGEGGGLRVIRRAAMTGDEGG